MGTECTADRVTMRFGLDLTNQIDGDLFPSLLTRLHLTDGVLVRCPALAVRGSRFILLC